MHYEKYDRCPHGKEWGSQGAYDMQRCQCSPQVDDRSDRSQSCVRGRGDPPQDCDFPFCGCDPTIRAAGEAFESRAVESVAQWMIAHSIATGHGDCIEDLLRQVEPHLRDLRFIEACPGCGIPRFYTNGDKGSDGGCDNGNLPCDAEFDCPLRKAAR